MKNVTKHENKTSAGEEPGVYVDKFNRSTETEDLVRITYHDGYRTVQQATEWIWHVHRDLVVWSGIHQNNGQISTIPRLGYTRGVSLDACVLRAPEQSVWICCQQRRKREI